MTALVKQLKKLCQDERDPNYTDIIEDYYETETAFVNLKRDKKYLNVLNSSGLNDFEVILIILYTSNHSKWINMRLRDGKKLDTECKRFFADKLDATLNKLPSFNNKMANSYFDVMAK